MAFFETNIYIESNKDTELTNFEFVSFKSPFNKVTCKVNQDKQILYNCYIIKNVKVFISRSYK